LAIKVDVGKEADVRVLVERTVQEFGRLDIMFNNAGPLINPSISPFTQTDQ